jgi:hypothetical protein
VERGRCLEPNVRHDDVLLGRGVRHGQEDSLRVSLMNRATTDRPLRIEDYSAVDSEIHFATALVTRSSPREERTRKPGWGWDRHGTTDATRS